MNQADARALVWRRLVEILEDPEAWHDWIEEYGSGRRDEPLQRRLRKALPQVARSIRQRVDRDARARRTNGGRS